MSEKKKNGKKLRNVNELQISELVCLFLKVQ